VIDCEETTASYCTNNSITCPPGDECTINCKSSNPCANKRLQCPSDYDCIIHCDESESCYSATIYAKDATQLELKGCTDTDSCTDLSIYCPVTDDAAQCMLEGNENLGSSAGDLSIYAVNGFDDLSVDVEYTALILSDFSATMYCQTDYSRSCDISASTDGSWSCSTTNSDCAASTSDSGSGGSSMDIGLVIIVVLLILFTTCMGSLCCWYNYRAKARAQNVANRMKHSESAHSQNSYSTQNLKKPQEQEPFTSYNEHPFDRPAPSPKSVHSHYSDGSNRSGRSRSHNPTGSRRRGSPGGSRHHSLGNGAQYTPHIRAPNHSVHSNQSYQSHGSHVSNRSNRSTQPFRSQSHRVPPNNMNLQSTFDRHQNRDSELYYNNPHSDGASEYDMPRAQSARVDRSDHALRAQAQRDHRGGSLNKRSPFALRNHQSEDPPSPKSAKSALSQSTIQYHEEKNIEAPSSFDPQTVGPGPMGPIDENGRGFAITVEDEIGDKMTMTTPSSGMEAGTFPSQQHGGGQLMDPIVESPEHGKSGSDQSTVYIQAHSKGRGRRQRPRPPPQHSSGGTVTHSPSPREAAASGDLLALSQRTSNGSESSDNWSEDTDRTKVIKGIMDFNGEMVNFGGRSNGRMQSQDLMEMKSNGSTPTNLSPNQSERKHVKSNTTPALNPSFHSNATSISTVSDYSQQTDNVGTYKNTNMFEPHKHEMGIDVIEEDGALEHVTSFDTTIRNMKHHLVSNGKEHQKDNAVSGSYSDYGGRSPDTWADFEAENGMNADNQEMGHMLLDLEDGQLAGSLYGMN